MGYIFCYIKCLIQIILVHFSENADMRVYLGLQSTHDIADEVARGDAQKFGVRRTKVVISDEFKLQQPMFIFFIK